MTADYQMNTGQEEFIFLSADRCDNRFVLTRAVLLKAVTLSSATDWKEVKHMHVYIHCFTFVCFTKSIAKETVSQS